MKLKHHYPEEKQVIGLLMDEVGGKIMATKVALRPKTYGV